MPSYRFTCPKCNATHIEWCELELETLKNMGLSGKGMFLCKDCEAVVYIKSLEGGICIGV